MSLIKCSECGTDVSSLAAACPRCAAPIANQAAARAVGQSVTTTELTSKALKKQALLATMTACIGVVLLVAAEPASGTGAIGGLMAFGGLVWFIATRLRTWWHHG